MTQRNIASRLDGRAPTATLNSSELHVAAPGGTQGNGTLGVKQGIGRHADAPRATTETDRAVASRSDDRTRRDQQFIAGTEHDSAGTRERTAANQVPARQVDGAGGVSTDHIQVIGSPVGLPTVVECGGVVAAQLVTQAARIGHVGQGEGRVPADLGGADGVVAQVV